jgi:ribosomal protein S18 acetylase RimI-like enzyme
MGQICFLCVDSTCSDASRAAAALIHAGETYLWEQGAQKIFGGSPAPSAPFYTAFYGGAEAIGLFHSDDIVINAFHEAGYQIHQTTTWFHLELQNYSSSVITQETASYFGEVDIDINDIPIVKTWREGCALANGIWIDATVYLIRTNRPIARLRVRITHPDADNILAMYGRNWSASLMELRIHPDFVGKGLDKYILREMIRYLITHNQIVQVEAHVAADTPLFTLLHNQSWLERDIGYVFVKNAKSVG